ncbi:MAG: tRNA (adenosine(37)-N6)-threonylcarbamoyltransferase complex transferase subunit TsaD [Candidatus Peregrinibacteria bacterium]
MLIFGIETSCDETAAAVVRNGTHVLSNVIASSVDLHQVTGGVVPEVAAREHLRQISPVVDKALRDAGVDWSKIDAIAVTFAPGLIGSLLVGFNTAQTLAYLYKKPFIPIHHIAGHIYANFLERKEKIVFPILVLTVSGGHNELILMKGHHQFKILGETLDDAAGEAFDKIARLLGLGYPGGSAIAKLAEKGNPKAFDFPRAHLNSKNQFNFSFSGLKTAVARMVKELCHSRVGGNLNPDSHFRGNDNVLADLCASFQEAVVEALADKLIAASKKFKVKEVHLAGGVSANTRLRQLVRERLPKNMPLVTPQKLIYCTDNAAMIAGAAYFFTCLPVGRKKIPKSIGVMANHPLDF